MKDYKGHKYFELEEIKNGGCKFGPNIDNPRATTLFVWLYKDTGEFKIALNTKKEIKDILKDNNPEKMIKEISEKTIDNYIKEIKNI